MKNKQLLLQRAIYWKDDNNILLIIAFLNHLCHSVLLSYSIVVLLFLI